MDKLEIYRESLSRNLVITIQGEHTLLNLDLKLERKSKVNFFSNFYYMIGQSLTNNEAKFKTLLQACFKKSCLSNKGVPAFDSFC